MYNIILRHIAGDSRGISLEYFHFKLNGMHLIEDNLFRSDLELNLILFTIRENKTKLIT